MKVRPMIMQRRRRAALLVVMAAAWAVGIAGAFAENGAVLGIGLTVLAFYGLGTVKLVFELAASSASWRDVDATVSSAVSASVRQLSADMDGIAERAAATIDGVEESAMRRSVEHEQSLRAHTSSIRADLAETSRQLGALEERLTPTRRFRAARRPGAPHELTLSETLGDAFEGDARR